MGVHSMWFGINTKIQRNVSFLHRLRFVITLTPHHEFMTYTMQKMYATMLIYNVAIELKFHLNVYFNLFMDILEHVIITV